MSNPYEGKKVLGPYDGDEGKFVIVMNSLTDKVKVPYDQYLSAIETTVNHQEPINHVPILEEPKTEAKTEEQKQETIQEYPITLTCIRCGGFVVLTEKEHKKLQKRQAKGSKGPFCSNKCIGLYFLFIRKEV